MYYIRKSIYCSRLKMNTQSKEQSSECAPERERKIKDKEEIEHGNGWCGVSN